MSLKVVKKIPKMVFEKKYFIIVYVLEIDCFQKINGCSSELATKKCGK